MVHRVCDVRREGPGPVSAAHRTFCRRPSIHRCHQDSGDDTSEKALFFHQCLKRQAVQVCRDRLRNITLPSALTSTTYAVLPTSSVWPRRRRRREKSGQTVKVNRHLNLVPRLRVNGAVSPLCGVHCFNRAGHDCVPYPLYR